MNSRTGFKAIILIVVLAIQAAANAPTSYSAPDTTSGNQSTAWAPLSLPSDSCPWSSSDNNCHSGSPVLSDLNDDGLPEIVLVTNKGHVMAVRANGAILWNVDTAPFFTMPDGSKMAAGTQEIASSPAVGDIDNDGMKEIVVGTGSIYNSVCTQGGVIVLDQNGKLKPGWPKIAHDGATGMNGCADSVYGSPAIGDLDNDGDMEIVVGGFDKRIYAWHHNGTPLDGFPADSFLSKRFPTWPNLVGSLGDTIWASPVLADMDRDGYLDIVLGTDEGNFEASWGGDAAGWSCDYALPAGWANGYCGGSLYVLDHRGVSLPGFPKYVKEAIQSTPAIADINEDGSPDILVGAGTFYHENSPDQPTDGFRFHAWDNLGNDLPGWEGGKLLSGTVPSSPAVGDIAGDYRPEVIVASKDGKLYAWHHDGTLVNGFPMIPVTQQGNRTNFDVGRTFILGDYDGDQKMEIIFSQAWAVSIVDGNGKQLTVANFPADNHKPMYLTGGSLLNNPAVGDIDGDGRLELVAHNGKLYVWDLNNSSDKTDWSMFKRNSERTGRFMPPALALSTSTIEGFRQVGAPDFESIIRIENSGDEPFDWTAGVPVGVTVKPGSGQIAAGSASVVTIEVDSSRLALGAHALGNVVFAATQGGAPLASSPKSIEVKTLVVERIYSIYVPAVQR